MVFIILKDFQLENNRLVKKSNKTYSTHFSDIKSRLRDFTNVWPIVACEFECNC